MAVDVVPPGVDDPTVVEHGRVPLVRLVEGNTRGLAPSRLDRGQGVDRAGAATAAMVAAPPGRGEDDLAAGQIDGSKVIERALGELAQVRRRRSRSRRGDSRRPRSSDVPETIFVQAGSMRTVGEEHAAAIVAELWVLETARPETDPPAS